MKDENISFEVAKLVKKLKINRKYLANQAWMYREDGKLDYLGGSEYQLINSHKWFYALPQIIVMKWLREKHNLHISVFPRNNFKNWEYVIAQNLIIDDPYSIFGIRNVNTYRTYERASEAGILEALKIIL